MYQNIDFIIVGGGLAGSILALELINRGADLLLIDRPLAGAASPIAAGIANPVTGKRSTRALVGC
jgi:glycine/D-amino acid oxidase-like deaminating enzyme